MANNSTKCNKQNHKNRKTTRRTHGINQINLFLIIYGNIYKKINCLRFKKTR